MNYKAITFRLQPASPENYEILSALLDEKEFEGLQEEAESLIAYISQEKYVPLSLDELKETLSALQIKVDWQVEGIDERNWNSEWERNFAPVLIDQTCVIRAPFHDAFAQVKYRITIEPKMSFGTGHHHTTRLMVQQILEQNLGNKSVLDMGCGTGVLGILASMRGAKHVICIDNDQWAYENTLENAERNHIANMDVILGGKERIPDLQFDVILANINRNILLDQVEDYALHCKMGGDLVVSGILKEDTEILESTFAKQGFLIQGSRESSSWVMMRFLRK